MSSLGAVVPAAGKAERFGGRKLERPFGESTILGTVIANLQAAGIDRIVVVLGHEPERLASLVAAAGAESVVNPRHELGMLTSIQAGLAPLVGCSAALVLPADLPLVQPETIQQVAAAEPAEAIVVPRCDGRGGHPLRIPGDLFGEVDRLDLEVGLRQLRNRCFERVLELVVDDPGLHLDIDRLDDYRLALILQKRVGGDAGNS